MWAARFSSSEWQRVFREIVRLLSGIAILSAFVYCFLYLIPALIRVRYPYELEWMEGAIVDHVRWILEGHALYGRPSLTFTPFIYTPLYLYLGALFTKILGVGFVPLRLISLLATIGTSTFLYLFAWRETRRPWFAWLAPGFFLAAYPLSGYWLDIARVDSLFVFFLFSSAYLLRYRRERWTIVFAALLAVAAFFTKQLAWMWYPSLIVALAYDRRWKEIALFCGTGVVVGGTVFALLYTSTQGWFWYYIVTIPAQHLWEWGMLTYFWLRDLLIPIGVLCVFAIFGCLEGWQKKPRDLFFPALLLGGVLMGWIARLHTGGYENVLLPTYAAFALIAILGVHTFEQDLEARPLAYIGIVIWVLILGQLAWLWYDPHQVIPDASMRAEQEVYQKRLAQLPQPIYLQSHGFWGGTAVPIRAHLMALADIIRGRDDAMRAELRAAFEQELVQHTYKTIIIDDAYAWEEELVKKYYPHMTIMPVHARWQISGAVTAPVRIYTIDTP